MKKTIVGGLATGAVALGLAVAGPAHADGSGFLQRAQQKIPYVVNQYGSSAVLNEGYKICRYEAQGTTGASDLADLITAENAYIEGCSDHVAGAR